MICKLSHVTIWVTDYDKALDFYTNKLGLEVRTDLKMDGGFRWLTVGPKDQPDLELILAQPRVSGIMDEDVVKHIMANLEKGVMSPGVFDTDDCRKTYQELKAKGVEFIQPPQDHPYGVEALFKDGVGNWFSLRQG
jgi:catechol 2,3-dioxygenase-like lactoylglutathione lyase family enzyme